MRSWSKVAAASDVKAVRGEIEGWRRRRVNGSPMPEELWQAAVSLGEKYGVFAVARSLPVDFGALKRRVGGRQASGRGGAHGAGFVEIDARPVVGLPMSVCEPAGAAVVEMSRPDGARMTIRLGHGYAVDAVGLAGAFLREGA